MASHVAPDMTIEQFDAWSESQRRARDSVDAAAEEGGPRVSLVPDPVSVPVDLLHDVVDAAPLAAAAGEPPLLRAVPFDPVPSRKVAGWSATRQLVFIEALAETGSVPSLPRLPNYPRAGPMRCASASRPLPRRGTRRSNSPWAACRRSLSTVPSMAASSSIIATASWSGRSACRASGC